MFFCSSSGRKDYVQGRLCFVFHSSMKNVKEVFICAAQGQRGPVRGEVRHCAPQITMHYSLNIDVFFVWAVSQNTMQILFSHYVTMQRPVDHVLGGMCVLAVHTTVKPCLQW